MIDWTAANIWTSAFFYPLTSERDLAIPTNGRLTDYIDKPKAAHGQLVGKANALAVKHGFFHWGLEFPDVAELGGFDVVLGNPPWERIKLQEQEFFATRDIGIATAKNKAAREKLIRKLVDNNPALLQEFEVAKHDAEATSKYMRMGGRFELTAIGDVNTYALFAECFTSLQNTKGSVGLIVPTGIATDDTTKLYFDNLMQNQKLSKLVGFENESFIFQSVHHAYKFCLLTITGKDIKHMTTDFVFFCRHFDQINEDVRHFKLGFSDIALINPNTKTCPIFRTRIDAELNRKIYQRVPVLVNEQKGDNPWGIEFKTMFHMSNDSNLFRNEDDNNRLPLYEAKMIWQFDHRYTSFEFATQANLNAGILPQTTSIQKQDSSYRVQPQYWVSSKEVKERILPDWTSKWLLVSRNITGSKLERTFVLSVIPLSGVGNSASTVYIENKYKYLVACLIGNVNSLIFDYITRQKIAGNNMNYFIVKQLTALAPSFYSQTDILFINPRVLELVYTSHDIKPFSEDLGYDCKPYKWDDERRSLIRAELDAYYAKLYGLTRDELCYILDPQDVYGEKFPGETFRVLKEKEIQEHGEYRTRRLVLEAWDRLFGGGNA
jgi:hypothetical protein